MEAWSLVVNALTAFHLLPFPPPVNQLSPPPKISTVVHCGPSLQVCALTVLNAGAWKRGLSFRAHKHLLGFLDAAITIVSPQLAKPTRMTCQQQY